MARAKTKEELLVTSELKYNTLDSLIKNNKEKFLINFNFKVTGKEKHWLRDNNARDVLYHLYSWHQGLIAFIYSIKEGTNNPFLPSPYNWKNYHLLNQEYFQSAQEYTLDEVILMLKESHKNVMTLINTFLEEELFNKNVFVSTGTTTLASYCISSTSSHYVWAINKLKKHLKSI